MTIIDLLAACNKASNKMREHDILLALTFRFDRVTFSASAKTKNEVNEISTQFTIQQLALLDKSVLSNQLTSLNSLLLEKVGCHLQS